MIRFLGAMLLIPAIFVACGDEDSDSVDVEEVVERTVGDISRTSDGIILENDDIFGGDTSVDETIEETIRDARNGDFDLDIDELSSSSADFPLVSDYLGDYRLAFYDLHYQCFERGNSRSRGTIESRRDGIRQLATDNLQSSFRRTGTGCNVELLFSGGVRCLGSLRYSGLLNDYNDRWNSDRGNTDLKWVCALTDRESSTRRLDYHQHVRCQGSLSEPPNDSQVDDCKVRHYDFDRRRHSSWSSSRAEDALYDADEHLDDIYSKNWNENCCRDSYGYSQNYREIFEVGTIIMKKSMIAIWSRADEFLRN